MIRSNTKIHNVGRPEVSAILHHAVVVQEKIDGSQFSFAVLDGELHCKSRSQVIDIASPPALFAPAVTWCIENVHDLNEGWTYRGEAVSKPRANKLTYGRAPQAGFVLFDVEQGEQDYLLPGALRAEAARLDVEVVPSVFFAAGAFGFEETEEWLKRESMLGGVKVEGFVIKAYGQRDNWGQTPMAKHVSDAFKEVMGTKKNPKQSPIEWMIERYRRPARWDKIVQHMTEREQLVHSMKDVGPLLKELGLDLLAEEKEEIKNLLFDHYWKDIQKGAAFGFAEWYRAQLLERQLDDNEA